MSNQALYDLLAKAKLHPNSLTHIERLIWYSYVTSNDLKHQQRLCKYAAAELEQIQQAYEAQSIKTWITEQEAE